MCVWCVSDVCLMCASCVSNVCLMYVWCMSDVCLMCVTEMEVNSDHKNCSWWRSLHRGAPANRLLRYFSQISGIYGNLEVGTVPAAMMAETWRKETIWWRTDEDKTNSLQHMLGIIQKLAADRQKQSKHTEAPQNVTLGYDFLDNLPLRMPGIEGWWSFLWSVFSWSL